MICNGSNNITAVCLHNPILSRSVKPVGF